MSRAGPALPARIVLVGLRGTGKSTVGRLLAERLARPFLDTDERIQQHSGRTIREIFDTLGEPAFRALERVALEHALAAPAGVISTGGGVVLSGLNRALLRERACCVWLQAPVEVLVERLQADPHTAAARPSLTAKELPREIEQLAAEREPLYAEVARLTLHVAARTPQQVVRDLLEALARSQPPDGAQP